MTSDPKALGTAAVYLSVEEIANDPLHYQSFYARIKILQEKGKELATVELPYLRGNFKIADIKGRTIHPDGTEYPLTGKPEDLLSTKNGDKQFGRKVFTLPNVEVGSIIEYRYDLRYDDNHYSSPFWEVQRAYFVHKAHYVFTPFENFQPGSRLASSRYLVDARGNVVNALIWWPILPPGSSVKSDASGHYTVDVEDIPAMPDEDWMPPEQTFRYKVQFYYKSVGTADEFWTTEAKRWSKDVDHFAEPSKSIQEAVRGLIAPGDSDLDKAKKLYKAVQALDNTDFSRKKGVAELKQLKLKEAKRAEDTWAQKSGDSGDIALLYLAMLRASGLSARAMKVVDREHSIFDPTYLSVDQLDDTIILLSIAGKEIALDPGEKMCPFETVHWRHSHAGGFVQSNDGRFAGISPGQAYAANKLTRIGDFTLDVHGGISGDLRLLMSGQEALRWRQTALENDAAEVTKRFDRWMESQVPQGVEAHVDHFLGLDDPDVNLMAVVKVTGALGTATAKRLMLPGFFFETSSQHPFVSREKRQTPVDMHYGDLVIDEVTYHLPAGFSLEGAPQETKHLWKDHATYNTVTKSSPGQIVIARQLARAFTFAKPDEYQDLRAFYENVAAGDQQQLVLTTSSVEKGN